MTAAQLRTPMERAPDPRLGTAPIPKDRYTSREFAAREHELMWPRVWQIACSVDHVATAGDYFEHRVGPASVLIVRGDDGELRAFQNVCRHRGNLLCEGSGGGLTQLQCPFHHWTWGLGGRLREVPSRKTFGALRNDDFPLFPVQVGTWGPFVFVNLDDQAPSLTETLAAIPNEVARAGFDLGAMGRVERRDYVIECNWKVYVDNYLEGYHIPIAHPALYREIDYDDYRVDTFRYYSRQHAPVRELKPGQELGRDRRYLRSPDGEEDALYYWLFPNTMFNFYPDNMSTNLILPLGPERTLTIFEWFFAQPGTGGGWESMQQTISFSDQIQQEDIALCEQVQRGLRSRSYDTGRFSALRENGVHHFQGLVREYLGE